MNKRFVRMAALGMTMVMTFSVTGCKSSESDNSKKEKAESTKDKSEYGYLVEYLNMQSEEYSEVHSFVQSGNKLYFAGAEYKGEEYMEGEAYIKTFDIDAKDEQKVLVSYEFGENTYVTIPYIQIEEDGKLTYMKQSYHYEEGFFEDVEEEPSMELGDISEDATVTEEYLSQLGIDLSTVGLEFSDVADMTVGEVVTMYETLNSMESEDAEMFEDNSETYLVTIDAEGKEVASLDISEAMKNVYPNSFMKGNDGKIYMYSESIVGDDFDNWEYQLSSIDTESGEVVNTKLDADMIAGMTTTGEGVIVAAMYGDEDTMHVETWDAEKKKFSGEDDKTLEGDWIDTMYPGEGDSFFYLADNKLYLYDMSDKEAKTTINLLDWNISGDHYGWISGTEEKLYVMSEKYSDNVEVTLNVMTRVAASELAEKTEITLGCLYTSEKTKGAVIEFNKANPEYKIVIRDYMSIYEDVEDYEELITKFNNDIMSEDAPDLIDLSSLDVDAYAGQGLFEDLYSYIEKDAEFSKKNLNESILKQFEYEGKLVALPSCYGLSLLASDKTLLGDSPLTLDKFEEVITANPDKEILDTTGRETMLAMLYSNNRNDLVDETNKTCNFTDGTFEKILNICAKFEAEEDIDYDYESMDSEPKRISEGKLLFYNLYLYDPTEYQIADLLFKNGCNVTGFPSAKGGDVTAFVNSDVFAINSKSEYKDYCWDFVKRVFEYDEFTFEFPVDNDMLDAMLEEACTPNMTIDENGNEVEDPMVYGWDDDFELEIYAMKEEEAAELKTLLNSVTALRASYDADAVYDIIVEEAEAFFAGEESAAEVCKIIQSRVDIFVNEDN